MLYTHRNDIAREQAIHLDLTQFLKKWIALDLSSG